MKTVDRLGILAVMLIAAALRFLRLDAQELRGDEAFGYFFSLNPYRQIVADTLALEEPHPVLSYFVQRWWLGIAGSSEFALRFTGGVFSVVAVALLFRLMLELELPPRIAVAGALLFAVSPYAVWHSQDARMYSMSIALTLAGTLLTVVWLRERRAASGAAYVVVSLLALHTHYFAAFIILAQNLYVVVRLLSGRLPVVRLGQWALLQAVLWALYAPWLRVARDLLIGYTGNADSPDLAEATARALGVFAVGETVAVQQRPAWALVGLLAVLLGIVALASTARYRSAAWLLGFYLMVPVMAAWYGSQTRPIFDERYLAAAVPPFYALAASSLAPLAAGASESGRVRRLSGASGGLLVALLLAGSALSLANYHGDPVYSKSRGWRELAATLERLSACTPPQRTRLAQNYPDPTLWYYFRGEPGHLVLPPLANDAVLAGAEVEALVAGGVDRVLFIAQPAPAWDGAHIGEGALSEQYVLAAVDDTSNWPIGVYVRPTVGTAFEPVAFENGATLLAHSIASNVVTPGGVAVVFLSWDGAAMAPEAVKVSVQLIDEKGRLAAQQDRTLARDGTGGEEAGRPESYGILLPRDAAAGEYRLITGLYRPESGERVRNADGADHVELGRVSVVPMESAECLAAQ